MHRRIPTPLAIGILSALIIGFATWAYFGDTALKQSRRMKLGREFLPAITNAVNSHSEFRHVQVGVGTAKTGCFLVVGFVETPDELSRLERLIAGTQPPLEVVYRLKILDNYPDKPSAEPGAPPNAAPPHR